MDDSIDKMTAAMTGNPIEKALAVFGTVVLDGALATVLEARGCNLVDKLWSAKVLIENPELIQQLHLDYFSSGARVVTTASYQATPQTYAHRGLNLEQSIELIKLSATLAHHARRDYLKIRPDLRAPGPVIVAGSVGPYGAYLANGSEYRGDYELDEAKMIDFHRVRVQALIDANVDLLAIETLPTLDEAKALVHLLSEFPEKYAWFSFTLRDEHHISNGTPLKEVAEYLSSYAQVAAIGINCVRLEFVTEALKTLRQYTTKPLIVYPNSGEHYDAVTKTWNSAPSDLKLVEQLDDWYAAGARLIGGCCRTTPEDIQAIAHHFDTNYTKPLKNVP